MQGNNNIYLLFTLIIANLFNGNQQRLINMTTVFLQLDYFLFIKSQNIVPCEKKGHKKVWVGRSTANKHFFNCGLNYKTFIRCSILHL